MTTLTIAVRHAEAIAGLDALGALLAEHPELPVDGYPDPCNVFARSGTDEQNRAEVDRVAAILGVTACWNGPRTSYTAERIFPGGFSYRITAVLAEEIHRSSRHMAPYLAELRQRMTAGQERAVAA